MDLKSFSKKIDLASKTQFEQLKLVAFYLYISEGTNEFNLETIISKLQEIGYCVNSYRLKNKLTNDKNFKKNVKTNNWIFNLKEIQQLQKKYDIQLEDRNEVESNSELLDEEKFSGKRGYLDRLICQANNCYKNHCYDACAVILRRIFEITLILAYRNHNIEEEIQDNNGQTQMLEKIVNNAIKNTTLKLSTRNLNKEYTDIRNIGNYAAHKIEYNTSFKDIDDIKTIYRVRLEELYHKAGLL